jgi:tetratricopeptide (TPR) repeat protein
MTNPNYTNFIFWLIAFASISIYLYIEYHKSKIEKYLNFSILSFCLSTLIGYLIFIFIPTLNKHKIHKTHKPEIKISIQPINDPCISSFEYPLHEYNFTILNKNKDSGQVYEIVIEFFFSNIITETILSDSMYSGGPFRIWDIHGCKRKNDGTIVHQDFFGNKDLKYAHIYPLRKKSNIAVFKCESWPTKSIICGSIIIDLDKRPKFVERPDEIGKFRAIYSYKVKNDTYPQNQIIGKIPDVDPTQKIAEKHFKSGLSFLKQKNFECAIKDFNKALEIYPHHEYALKNRGYSYGKIGKHKLASNDFSHYIELRPKDNIGYYYLAIAKELLGDSKGAKDDFYKSFQLGNDSAFKKYLVLILPDINPENGFIERSIKKDDWLEFNNKIITVIPEVKKKGFKIHAFKDKDNIFKVIISNAFSKNAELKFSDFNWLKNKPWHPKHKIKIIWANNENKLLIDKALVDVFPIDPKNINLHEKTDTFLFHTMREVKNCQGSIFFSISSPELFEKDGHYRKVMPHLYRNGLEISVYKDIDNVLKVLTTNKYGNNIILMFDDFEKLKKMESHPKHELAIKWSNGKTGFFIDGILVNMYADFKLPH